MDIINRVLLWLDSSTAILFRYNFMIKNLFCHGLLFCHMQAKCRWECASNRGKALSILMGYWGCAAGWGRIFTTGLTKMGLPFRAFLEKWTLDFSIRLFLEPLISRFLEQPGNSNSVLITFLQSNTAFLTLISHVAGFGEKSRFSQCREYVQTVTIKQVRSALARDLFHI